MFHEFVKGKTEYTFGQEVTLGEHQRWNGSDICPSKTGTVSLVTKTDVQINCDGCPLVKLIPLHSPFSL